jgi:hypothetical protein
MNGYFVLLPVIGATTTVDDGNRSDRRRRCAAVSAVVRRDGRRCRFGTEWQWRYRWRSLLRHDGKAREQEQH